MINDKLKVHFIKDYGLPMSTYQDPYFSERLDLFEKYYGSRTKWDKLLVELGERHPETFLNRVIEETKKIITTIEESEPFQDFREKFNAEDYKVKTLEFSSRDIYSGELVGRTFLSVDLVEANFQALRFYDSEIFYNCDTWADFIKKFTDSEYMAKTKLNRQRILGKLEPKHQIVIEKYIMSGIIDGVKDLLMPFSINNDELIFDITEFSKIDELIDRLYGAAGDSLGIRIRVNSFTLRSIQLFTETGRSIFGFWKEYSDDKVPSFHGIPNSYLPQFIKIFEGKPISDSDLVFTSQFDDLLARFLKPLMKR